MTAYYNEIDPYAAQWLRNLIDAGHIAPGVVDERSIEDVKPAELAGYTQCHFFAGIGVWSLALRRAGWPDNRPVWTGSCPCQPFSAAGKIAGFDDERHLWPAFYWLIGECRPRVIIGEQVASKAAELWLDLVQADMETLGYAFGAVAFPSASVGAPHIRDRTYWVGHADHSGLEVLAGNGSEAGRQRPERPATSASVFGRLGDSGSESSERDARGISSAQAESSGPRRENGRHNNRHPDASETFGLAQPDSNRREPGIETAKAARHWNAPESTSRDDQHQQPSPTNGFWESADWLFCRDGKWRPVEPGTFPLAHGASSRVGRLRAYGNAINAKAAEEFIRCVM